MTLYGRHVEYKKAKEEGHASQLCENYGVQRRCKREIKGGKVGTRRTHVKKKGASEVELAIVTVTRRAA